MKTMLGLTLAGLVGGLGVLAGNGTAEFRCSLTGETLQECCCIEKDGSLYCSRAEKPIEKCCCDSAS